MKRLVLAALALAWLTACAPLRHDDGAGDLFKVLICKRDGRC
ncbi:lipoprotein [Bosea sp. BK604]|nr:lipoprotein [Bosea sp. BK604]